MSRHGLKSGKKKKSGRIGRTFLLFFLLLLIGAGALAWFILFETEKPIITITGKADFLGKRTEIPIMVTDQRSGLRSIVVEIEQAGTTRNLLTRSFTRRTWMNGAGPLEVTDQIVFDAEKAGLEEGKATLVITARDFSLNSFFRGNAAVTRHEVTIDTSPPQIGLKHTQRYIRPGGSGIIVYDVSEPVASQGVIVNEQFFPGFPMEDTEGRYVAYIGLPWDTAKIELSRVVAVDEAGNEGQSVFSMILKNVSYKKDRINISDNFLNSKIPEFEGYSNEVIEGENLVEKFLYVNGELRRRNAQRIKEICSDAGSRRLWQDKFQRMPGQKMAGYAEQRTYYYQGKAIDQQVHLGIDIASIASAQVRAANRGRVIFADYLGIYGNTVILDHGQGVFSLYSHLSRIDTIVEEIVDQGTIIGYTGATGMAGGDHLHFSVLINGIFVTPLEWMDQNWININITDILKRL